MEKYDTFITLQFQDFRQTISNPDVTTTEKERWWERVKWMTKFSDKVVKLQAAINLNQRPVINRLTKQLDLLMEEHRLLYG